MTFLVMSVANAITFKVEGSGLASEAASHKGGAMKLTRWDG